jgi:hypothetical protein
MGSFYATETDSQASFRGDSKSKAPQAGQRQLGSRIGA